MNSVFKALNDQTRRDILELLQQRDMTAGEIVDQFTISGPSISHHLDLLKQAGLVNAEKEGQYIYYSLNTTVVDDIMKWFLQFKTKRNKMNKLINWLVALVILIPGIYLAFAWNSLPAKVPMHFDINGNADRYGDKSELLRTVLILPAVSLFVYFLLANIYRIDPKKYAVENRVRLKRIAFAIVCFISALTCIIIYSASHGGSKFDVSLILSAVGLLFAIIGNYLPNLKPNYFAGMRLPWTLENPENWRKTHALAGKLWFAGGLLLAVTCLFYPQKRQWYCFCGDDDTGYHSHHLFLPVF